MREKRSTRRRVRDTTYLSPSDLATMPNSDDEVHRADALAALRENQRLLRELVYVYRMPRHLARTPTSMSLVSAISCPHDVVKLLGEEMSTVCQEQLRIVMLDTKNHVLGCNVIYRGHYP